MSTLEHRGSIPEFAVVSGEQVHRTLAGQSSLVVELVETAYRLHGSGMTVNPPSYFLRFPERPSARIIALPASVTGPNRLHGLKWVSSFPANVLAGLPRASAVLVLNDFESGYPFACMEGSIISAARTAASAVLAARWLSREDARPTTIGFLGSGLIARYVHSYLVDCGWSFDAIGIHDPVAEHVKGFGGHLHRAGAPASAVTAYDSAERLIRSSELVVCATTATSPHIASPAWFAHRPLVLNISLRDLATSVVLASANIVDDVDHCLRADTAPHLAEQQVGHRDFIDGTLYDVMTGQVNLSYDKPVVFSPFGLGVLDLVVGKYVYDVLARGGDLRLMDDFYFETRRYG